MTLECALTQKLRSDFVIFFAVLDRVVQLSEAQGWEQKMCRVWDWSKSSCQAAGVLVCKHPAQEPGVVPRASPPPAAVGAEGALVPLPTPTRPGLAAGCVHLPKIMAKGSLGTWQLRRITYMYFGVENNKLEHSKLRWWDAFNSVKYMHFRSKGFCCCWFVLTNNGTILFLKRVSLNKTLFKIIFLMRVQS